MEWESEKEMYLANKKNLEGIRSSQIAALIGLLIKKGVLNGD